MRKHALKEKIIRHTVNVINETGLNNFTVDDISTDMVISKRTFYEIFESKSALIKKCLIYIAEEHKGRVVEIMENNPDNHIMCLQALIKYFIDIPCYAKQAVYPELEYKYGFKEVKDDVMSFWQDSFCRVMDKEKGNFIKQTLSNHFIRIYFDCLEYLRQETPCNFDAYVAANIFLRGMLNKEGIGQMEFP